jgi:hypothetical protein
MAKFGDGVLYQCLRSVVIFVSHWTVRWFLPLKVLSQASKRLWEFMEIYVENNNLL